MNQRNTAASVRACLLTRARETRQDFNLVLTRYALERLSLRENVAVDWAHHRESAHARLRVLVKRILRKYGYPPDLQDAAVQTVPRQAEVLSASWQPGHPRA